MKTRLTILCENSAGKPFGVIGKHGFAHFVETENRICALIGRTHLVFNSDEQFEETLKALDNYRIDRIGVSHCTGLYRPAVPNAKLKERLFFDPVGAALGI